MRVGKACQGCSAPAERSMVSQPAASLGQGFAVGTGAQEGSTCSCRPSVSPKPEQRGHFWLCQLQSPAWQAYAAPGPPPGTEGPHTARPRPPPPLALWAAAVQAPAAGAGKGLRRGSPKLHPWPGSLPVPQPAPLEQSRHRLRNLFPAACAQPSEATPRHRAAARAVTDTRCHHC